MWFTTLIILILVAMSMPQILSVLGYADEKTLPALLVNLVSGAIIFVIGLHWKEIRSLAGLDFLWLRFIFGTKSVENGQLNITVDTFSDGRPFSNGRYVKTFPDGHRTGLLYVRLH